MPVDQGTASDSTYHSRHARRTLARAARIGEHIAEPGTLLDVGCNNGITSRYMLDNGHARHVTGIELHATTVESDPLERDEFELIEGNVVDLDLTRNYDHIIYGAVHHHILNLFGLSAAVRTLQKLVLHCDKHLFFESGQIGEGGRWEWQRQMRRRFRTDEEHFFYLLRSIEHLIDGFEVIGSFWIHGIRRQYLRIDIKQGQQSKAAVSMLPLPTEMDGPFVNSRGSRDQVFERSDEPLLAESAAHFWISDQEDPPLFLKKFVHAPGLAGLEYAVGSQVEQDWAVRPAGIVEPGDTLAFPYLRDAASILSFRAAPQAERRRLAAAVDEIFDDAFDTEITWQPNVLLAPGEARRLADIVDLNANNFLVARSKAGDMVSVVDFEPLSTSYAARNRLHYARILWALQVRRTTAALLFARGWLGLVRNLLRYQFVPFKQRVVERQPSLASVLVSDLRTIAGRAAAAMLRPFGLG